MDSTATFILFALFAGASALGLRVDTNEVASASASLPWKLAMTINPSDGHNFGYGAPEWSSGVGVGAQADALAKDYLNSAVWNTPANYIAIARHNQGKCEAVKVWQFQERLKSLKSYFANHNPGRLVVTTGGPSYEDVPDSLANKASDPVFGAERDLVFNWWYSNNGCRICLDQGHHSGNLPGTGQNDDDFHGFGNEFGANTQFGGGSTSWWHDIANIQGDCHGGSCSIQGSDHGTGLQTGPVYGLYSIYVTNSEAGASAVEFPCDGDALKSEMASSGGSVSAAKGDPHLMNIKGEAFDVMQTGNMMLLEVPRGSFPATLDLALHADIERLGVVSCGPTFITSASITGRWIGVPLEIRSGHIAREGRPQPKHTFAIRFDGQAWLPHAEMQRTIELSEDATLTARDRMFLFQLRGLDIAVSQPKRPRIFLDIQVKGLGNLKTEIGGLLGIDDHSSVEKLPSGCEMSASSLSFAAAREDEVLQWSARALL